VIGPDLETALNALDILTSSVKSMDDKQLQRYVETPENRDAAKTLRGALKPFLEKLDDIRNADRRIAAALAATAGKRRL
jgi:hypothetical protein